jgi:two-component system cell cycle sensor histidine kinase/response regulator CckA
VGTGITSQTALILVVDDESVVRRFTRSILERAGHQVIEASRAEEALQVLEEHGTPPDLLLTDIVMPGMNGIALAGEAHQKWPDLHVLFMSGFSGEYEAELTGSVCVSKPFKPDQLLTAVHSALGSRTGQSS